eukprot:CAMPEP_0180705852 /NCGR_PEP_ID=MMETSP1038_2-20121128/7891_1 /TAXON_ID=632150 /ORGANISM="Azadinium spinosum, Strain 3D9" /LENGTH=296 /DNA_ID=CAMNT_0022737741 /DNA_START=237 /DNA_END=1124 /DNA_ORIENTATION=+
MGGLAVFNRPLSLMLNDTDMMASIINATRRTSHIKEAQMMFLMQIASLSSYVVPELTPYVKQLGGLDVLFEALDAWPDDGNVTLSAWKGLSDHSHSELGAATIANHGGPMEGIKYVMEKVKKYDKYKWGEDEQTLTVMYESLQIVNGLLEIDSSGIFGYTKDFVEMGLVEEVTRMMSVEADLRPTVDVACWVIKWISKDENLRAQLLKAGVVAAISKTFDTFHETDNRYWNGGTLGLYYPVIPTCNEVLKNLAHDDSGVEEMIRQGIPAKLSSVRADFRLMVWPLQLVLEGRLPGW